MRPPSLATDAIVEGVSLEWNPEVPADVERDHAYAYAYISNVE